MKKLIAMFALSAMFMFAVPQGSDTTKDKGKVGKDKGGKGKGGKSKGGKDKGGKD